MKPMTLEWVAKAEGDFAVSFRYPGESVDRSTALDARRRCRAFRQSAREALGLETPRASQ
jgi:hypothetical protein